jgi:hypothetical protein
MPARWWILVTACVLAGTGCSDNDSPANGGSGGAAGMAASGGSATGTGGVPTAGAAGAGSALGAAGAGSRSGDGSANVIAVAITGDPNAYYFDVTLETTDVDCSHFADWWEVLTPDGELLYRRILAHPHTEGLSGNPFTRSGGPVAVPADQEVVVRAHLNDLGYVGVVQRGAPGGTFVDANDIDANFAASVEAEEPQPAECIPEEQIVGG